MLRCLVFTRRFPGPQKSSMNSGCFAERNVQLEAFYTSLQP